MKSICQGSRAACSLSSPETYRTGPPSASEPAGACEGNRREGRALRGPERGVLAAVLTARRMHGRVTEGAMMGPARRATRQSPRHLQKHR